MYLFILCCEGLAQMLFSELKCLVKKRREMCDLHQAVLEYKMFELQPKRVHSSVKNSITLNSVHAFACTFTYASYVQSQKQIKC